MGGCQNYGPFLGTLNIRGHIIIGTQKGTIILTTNHIFNTEPFAWLLGFVFGAYKVSFSAAVSACEKVADWKQADRVC